MRTKTLFLACFVLFATLNSCVTYKRCQNKYPSKNDTIRISTVRDSIVIRDTTVYIHLPGDTVWNQMVIPCPPPPPEYVPKKVCAETSLAKACAWWSYPVIKIELTQKDTTIEKRLAGALQESYYWRTLYEKVHITPAPVKYIPQIYKIALWLWVGVIISIAGFVVLKMLKFI